MITQLSSCTLQWGWANIDFVTRKTRVVPSFSKKEIMYLIFFKITKLGYRRKKWLVHKGIKYLIFVSIFLLIPSPSVNPLSSGVTSWIIGELYFLATQSEVRWLAASLGSLLEMQSWAPAELLNPNLHFKPTSRWFLCTFIFEESTSCEMRRRESLFPPSSHRKVWVLKPQMLLEEEVNLQLTGEQCLCPARD